MIHGIGIDIVSVERFRLALERWGERLTGRLFTGRELEYCLSRRRPHLHMAVRFAAKEALFKALGRPLGFRDVEVVRGGSGMPELRVAGLTGNYRFSVSMSHEREFGVAQVVVERECCR